MLTRSVIHQLQFNINTGHKYDIKIEEHIRVQFLMLLSHPRSGLTNISYTLSSKTETNLSDKRGHLNCFDYTNYDHLECFWVVCVCKGCGGIVSGNNLQ